MPDTQSGVQTAAAPTAGKSGGLMWVVAAVGGVLVLGLGGTAAFAAFGDPKSDAVKTLSKTPVINLLVTNKTKGRVILQEKVEMLTEDDGINKFIEVDDEGKTAISIKVEGDALETLSEGMALTMIDVTAETKAGEDGMNGTLTAKVEMAGTEYEAALDFAADEEYAYIKIASFPDDFATKIIGGSMSQLEEYYGVKLIDQWYSLVLTGDTAVFDANAYLGIEGEASKETMEVVVEFLGEDKAEFKGVETVKDQKTYHFTYDFTKDELVDFSEKIAEIQDQEFDKEEVEKSMEVLKSLTADVWLNEDGSIVKVGFEAKMESEGESLTASGSVEIWDQGKKQDVEMPSDSESLEELINTLFAPNYDDTGYDTGDGYDYEYDYDYDYTDGLNQ